MALTLHYIVIHSNFVYCNCYAWKFCIRQLNMLTSQHSLEKELADLLRFLMKKMRFIKQFESEIGTMGRNLVTYL